MADGQSVLRFPSYGVTVTINADDIGAESPDDASAEETRGFVHFVLHFIKTTPHALSKIHTQERWDILEALYEDWLNLGAPRD